MDGSLPALERLILTGTSVNDVSGLSGLAGLKSLNLVGTQVRDVSGLSGLTALETLWLYDTAVRDVSALQHLIDNGLSVIRLLLCAREPAIRQAYASARV